MATNPTGQANDLGLSLMNGVGEFGLTLDPSGALVIMDFLQKLYLDGHAYQVRAGTISTPLVGDVVITDTAAEWCMDPQTGMTLLPIYNNITVRLATGTLHEYAVKSVSTASTAGTVFVALPLLNGAAAASTTCRVAAAGGVTVTAELATTTVRHWEWSNPAAGFTGALPGDQHQEWSPRPMPPIKSTSAAAKCLYVQVAATGTGPSYYGHTDFFEVVSAAFGI